MFPLRDTQPSYSRPVITVFLIVLNVMVFLLEFSMDPYTLNGFMDQYGLVPVHFQLINVFTSMFLHAGWLHVLSNMWFLWIFGDNIEDILGHEKFLLFYLLCGVAAALTQVFFNVDSRVPMVGASGAIAGVMGAYLVKFPRARILTLLPIFIFFTTIDVPAWVMLIYWFGLQLLNGVGGIADSQVSQGGTAFFAHVGGFVAGIVLIHVMGARQPFTRRRDLNW